MPDPAAGEELRRGHVRQWHIRNLREAAMHLPSAPLLLQSVTRWECPNCDVTDVTQGLPSNGTRFHTCAGLHMLSAPLVRAGTRCKVEAEERADYLRGEIQATGDDGKPYMAVRTTRDDGEDLAVNAGLARARMGED